MIKPEHIPDEVAWKLHDKLWSVGGHSVDNVRAAIAAALDAWPEMKTETTFWSNADGAGCGRHVLSLPFRRRTAMSESDVEFVERIKREWDGDNVPCVEDFDQLIALARRGAAAIADDQCKKEPELPHQDRRFNNAERLFGGD